MTKPALVNKWFSISVVAAVASASAFQNDAVVGLPTFRANTRLVQVNVVAFKNGKPVTDLRKEEFELSEDGRRQDLAVFVTERANIPARPALPPNEFSNQLTTTNSARSGYTVILLDWLNSGMYARITSQQQVLKLLKQIELRDLVSLCVLDRGFRVLHDFTSDRAELIRKISATYVALQEGPPEDLAAVSSADTLDLSQSDLSVSRMTRFMATRRVLDTLSAFEQIASYLGSVPGRKSMIWVTSGFPSSMGYDVPPPRPGVRGANPNQSDNQDQAIAAWERATRTDRRTFSAEMERAFRKLNDADIAVYPVDARGLIMSPGAYINIAAMKEIAERTGGKAYYNRNDLDTAIRSAIDDASTSYTLGYYPSNRREEGKFRAIRVKVRRAGVELRNRRGYVERDNKRETAPRIDLEQVIGSPLDATLIPVSARAERSGDKVSIQVRVDPSTLSLREENGRRKGKISIVVGFRPGDQLGRYQIETASRNLDLSQETYLQMLRQGLIFRRDVPLPPKATSLRIVVRDDESLTMGSLTIPLNGTR